MLRPVEWKQHKFFFIDQTKLPGKIVRQLCRNPQQIAEAIQILKIRGGGAIGVAAAFGVYLGIKMPPIAKTYDKLMQQINKLCHLLSHTRPTGMSLEWALERMRRCAQNNRDHKIITLREILLREAISIWREEEKLSKTISNLGVEMIRDGDSILTYGNTGALATGGVGTALGIISEAVARRKDIQVLVCETRPYLEGSRLTAWELKQAKIPFKIITDNMAAYFMKKNSIHVVLAGGDRITMHGDVAAPIGTYALAMLAYYHSIPFYIAAPIAAFDRHLMSGDLIPIEERKPEEVAQFYGKNVLLPKMKILNPVFDVTPHKYISAIITELGVVRAPYDQNLRNLFSNLN